MLPKPTTISQTNRTADEAFGKRYKQIRPCCGTVERGDIIRPNTDIDARMYGWSLIVYPQIFGARMNRHLQVDFCDWPLSASREGLFAFAVTRL